MNLQMRGEFHFHPGLPAEWVLTRLSHLGTEYTDIYPMDDIEYAWTIRVHKLDGDEVYGGLITWTRAEGVHGLLNEVMTLAQNQSQQAHDRAVMDRLTQSIFRLNESVQRFDTSMQNLRNAYVGQTYSSVQTQKLNLNWKWGTE